MSARWHSVAAGSGLWLYTVKMAAASNRSIASTWRIASALKALVGIGCFTQGAS